MWHAYWSSSLFLQNIIKICLRVSKLWSTQDFGFRGDNYITKKKLRVVSLACDIPTGSLLHLNQIVSYYLKQYENYGQHKISASGETTTLRRKWVLCLLHRTRILVLLFISTKHYQNMSKGIKVMERTRFWPRGENYITKKVRVVSPAQDMPTGLPLRIKICVRMSKLWSTQGCV